jgi:hypothetical protein
VVAASIKKKKYADHFKIQHYELNPIWQKDISHKKWFNPRHIVLVIIATVLLICIIEFLGLSPFYANLIFGCLFVLFGLIIGRHISNILIFFHIATAHDEISGEVKMAHSLILYLSIYQYIGFAIPLILILTFAPTPFVLGGIISIGILIIVHLNWIRKFKKVSASKE